MSIKSIDLIQPTLQRKT